MGIRALGEEEGGLCEIWRVHCGAEAEFEEGGGCCPIIRRRAEGWVGGRESIGLAFRWGRYVVWKRNSGDVEEGDWGGGDLVGYKATRRAAITDCSKG